MTGGWGTPTWQGGDVLPGDVFCSDKSQEMARDLLDAAETLKLDPIVVRTTTAGFIVPQQVWDTAQDARRNREGMAF